MPKKLLLFSLGVVLVMMGCTTTGGTKILSYVEDKPRVDQEMAQGNAGYLMGQPVPEDRSKYSKTRKVYVLEVTNEPAVQEEVIVTPEPSSYKVSVPSSKSRPTPDWTKPVSIPAIDFEAQGEDYRSPEPVRQTTWVDYEVQKGDTLQKISKHFYGSYSKWSRIMEANKEVLKDPNRIKPGMKLRVPVDEIVNEK